MEQYRAEGWSVAIVDGQSPEGPTRDIQLVLTAPPEHETLLHMTRDEAMKLAEHLMEQSASI